jgi:hypothetical protein
MTDHILDIDFDYFVRESLALDWGHREAPFFQEALWPIRYDMAKRAGLNLEDILDSDVDLDPERFWEGLQKKGFEFDDKAPTLVGDSHVHVGMQIPHLVRPGRLWELWHFDAHHDLGYDKKRRDRHDLEGIATCEDWLYFLARDAVKKVGGLRRVHIVYPNWRREKDPIIRGADLHEVDADGRKNLIEEFIQFGWNTVSRSPYCELTFQHFDGIKLPDKPPPVFSAITISLSSAWVPPWYDKVFERFVEDAPGLDIYFVDKWAETGFKPREWRVPWESESDS